jgi:hypothetical protein
MDLSEQLEQARGVAYDGTLWDVVEMAAREGGEVESYLMHHAAVKFGGGVRRLVSLEALVPWRKLEVWMPKLGVYPVVPPINSPEAQKRDEVKAWMNVLSGISSDRGERDWRLLMCGLTWCRSLEDMAQIVKALDFQADSVIESSIEEYWIRVGFDRFRLGSSGLWISERGGGTITSAFPKSRKHPARVAGFVGIEPPARVIAGLGG